MTGTLSNFTGPAGPTYTINDNAAVYGAIAGNAPGTGASGAAETPGAGGTVAPGGATGAGVDNAAAANAYLDCINAATDDAGRAACVSKLSQP